MIAQELAPNRFDFEAVAPSGIAPGFDVDLFRGHGLSRFNSFVREYVDVEGLPPRKYVNIPKMPVPTPTDPYGQPLVAETLQVVRGFIDSAHVLSKKTKVHHLKYLKNKYEDLPDAIVNPAEYRNSPPLKIDLPIDFEGVLHESLADPIVPSTEVMYEGLRAWKATDRFYWAVRITVMLERYVSEYLQTEARPDRKKLAHLVTAIDRNFTAVERHAEVLYTAPPEFRIVDPDVSLKELALRVGPLSVKGAWQSEMRRSSLSLRI